MKFEERALRSAIGWSLAHSLLNGSRRLQKGTLVTEDLVQQLDMAGIQSAQVYCLEKGDLDENTAAETAANLIAGKNLAVELAGKGRANLIAMADGVFVSATSIDRINHMDDAFSAASLRPYTRVSKHQLVATIKLIPYGIAGGILDKVNPGEEKAHVAAFRKFNAVLLTTGQKPNQKTLTILSRRVADVGGQLEIVDTIEHTTASVSRHISQTSRQNIDLILILGTSAISDERDILPEGLRAAGGSVTKVGMPTDPGNLLMLGKHEDSVVIGLPGCARSPALNGIDWILERFAAGLSLDRDTLTLMGTGGLLKEPVGRRVPRTSKPLQRKAANNIYAAILLAAGTSSRANNSHKLLSRIGDRPVICASLSNIQEAGAIHTVVVTGDQEKRVKACLANFDTHFVYNTHFTAGMGGSLALGVQSGQVQLADYAFVCLGDMPFIRPDTFKLLMKTADQQESPAIIIPTFHGKRGHPVLWHQLFFSELGALSGETGGKTVMQRHNEKILEIPVDDPGILIDLDTPEMLAHFGIIPVNR